MKPSDSFSARAPEGGLRPHTEDALGPAPTLHVALAAWERGVVLRERMAGVVKSDVSESWQRSLLAQVDPSLPRAPRRLDADALAAQIELPCVRLAQAVLAPHVESIASCGHALTLFDAQGCMLSSAGAPATLAQLDDIQFTPGSSWSESVVGTNGPGTALALLRPVHIVGAEHFCASFHPWHCAAVPLIDPDSHQLLGALDISGDRRTGHPYVLALVSALGRSIEQAIRLRSQQSALLARVEAHPQLREQRVDARRHAPLARPTRVDANVSAVCTTRYELRDLTGHHPSLLEARRLATIASENLLPVLLLGESGVGKEVVAQSIHAASARAEQPFIAVNCGAIASELIESELFGYVAGAFSGAQRSGSKGKFEAAEGGTLLLDEICELPAAAQAALLRALQERQITPVGGNHPRAVDVRIIAATHRDLQTEIASGRFRLDLFYRLDVLEIKLPPLRARGADILALAVRFLERAANETGRMVTLAPEVEAALLRYGWPGNVRELENLMRRLSATSRGPEALLTELPASMHVAVAPQVESAEPVDPHKLELMAVIRSARTMAEAARSLGVTRSTLYRRLERFGLVPSRWVQDSAK